MWLQKSESIGGLLLLRRRKGAGPSGAKIFKPDTLTLRIDLCLSPWFRRNSVPAFRSSNIELIFRFSIDDFRPKKTGLGRAER